MPDVACERCDYIGPDERAHDRWNGTSWVLCRYYEWACDEHDFACGSVDEAAAEEGKRLHLRMAHDGLSFGDAVREHPCAKASQ